MTSKISVKLSKNALYPVFQQLNANSNRIVKCESSRNTKHFLFRPKELRAEVFVVLKVLKIQFRERKTPTFLLLLQFPDVRLHPVSSLK